MIAESLLESGARQLNLYLNPNQIIQYHHYLALLQKWSKAFNLTTLQSERQMIIQHLLDCLSVVPYLKEKAFIDVGSGAGFPGMVLAIFQPTWQIILIDSLEKRCHFLHQVARELQLDNVQIHHSRIENCPIEMQQDSAIITRAFANLSTLVKSCTANRKSEITIYAMKGRLPSDEMTAMQADYPNVKVQKIYQLEVPYLNAERHLLQIAIKC